MLEARAVRSVGVCVWLRVSAAAASQQRELNRARAEWSGAVAAFIRCTHAVQHYSARLFQSTRLMTWSFYIQMETRDEKNTHM